MHEESGRLSRVEASLEYIRDKLDKMDTLITAITQMQADHAHHKEALGRAFGRMEELERRLDRNEAEIGLSTAEIKTAIQDIRSRMRMQAALLSGIFIGGGAVWGLVAWTLRNDVLGLLNAVSGVMGTP